MDSFRKREIINLDKGSFLSFLKDDTTGEILEVLDDEGVNYLKEYSNIENRITYILNWSKYKNEIFYNNNFLNLFLSINISDFFASLSGLNDNTYDLIISKCFELNKSVSFIGSLISYFGDEYQLKLIDRYDYPNDLIYELFNNSTSVVGDKILKKFNIDLLSHNISIEDVISVGKKLYFRDMSIRFEENWNDPRVSPYYLSSDLLNMDVAEYLWNKSNVYKYRSLVTDACYCGDASNLNKYAKEKEEKFILGHKNIIDLVLKLRRLDGRQEIYNLILNSSFISDCLTKSDYQKLESFLASGDYDKVIELIKNISNNKGVSEIKSDYIIDYHFEENYYNIMYDLRELLNFYYAGNINIPDERLYFYQQIANIDMLSDEDKVILHNKLKNYNIMEAFYDDMSFARKVVREAIKDYAMVEEELKKFKDDKLSLEYGVDVYNIDDNPFFALVRSGGIINGEYNSTSGHSYSMVGNGCISIFGDLNNSNTFVYDSANLNPNQVVHVFPNDSYTSFHPFKANDSATDSVERLMMPDELLYESINYNEILILEQGKNLTDFAEKIPRLKKIALYCVDNITENDVKTAKINGVGIMLINSKRYNKGVEMPKSVYRHLNDNNYLTYMQWFDNDEVEKHKRNR